MNAYWNIVLPYEVSFENKPENQALFDSTFRPEYAFVSYNNYEVAGPLSEDGSHITYVHHDKVFALKQELIQNEFKTFYQLFIQEFVNFCNHYADRSFYAKIFDKDKFTEFLTGFENIPLNAFDDAYIDRVNKLPGNEFISFKSLYSMIVYEGYPFPNDFTIKTVNILSSFEGMNLDAKETLTFHHFTHYVRKMLSQRFRMARHIFNLAY